MSRFSRAQSAMVGAVMAGLVRATGGDLDTVDDLRVARCGWLRLYGRAGTQWGDVFVTGKRMPAAGVVAHEKHHRDAQWRRYGLAFGCMYLWAEIIDVWIGRSLNRYELAAEEASDWGGGYPRPE